MGEKRLRQLLMFEGFDPGGYPPGNGMRVVHPDYTIESPATQQAACMRVHRTDVVNCQVASEQHCDLTAVGSRHKIPPKSLRRSMKTDDVEPLQDSVEPQPGRAR